MGGFEVKDKNQGKLKQPVKTGKSTANESKGSVVYSGKGYEQQKARVSPRTRAGIPLKRDEWNTKLIRAGEKVDQVYDLLFSKMNTIAQAYSNAWDAQKDN